MPTSGGRASSPITLCWKTCEKCCGFDESQKGRGPPLEEKFGKRIGDGGAAEPTLSKGFPPFHCQDDKQTPEI
ncbi:hypothetical protein GN956_G5830 [Arapaima gigas]